MQFEIQKLEMMKDLAKKEVMVLPILDIRANPDVKLGKLFYYEFRENEHLVDFGNNQLGLFHDNEIFILKNLLEIEQYLTDNKHLLPLADYGSLYKVALYMDHDREEYKKDMWDLISTNKNTLNAATTLMKDFKMHHLERDVNLDKERSHSR